MPPPRLEIDSRTIRMILVAFAVLAALSIHRLWMADLPHGSDVLILSGKTMGTTYEIRVAGGGLTDPLRERLEAETKQRLADVDRWMSNWNPESEVSKFNAHRSKQPFDVSFETAELVAYAVEVAKLSGAAFDITIGPAVRLWGFGHEARLGGPPPTQKEIDAALAYTGARILRIGRGNKTHGGFLIKGAPEVEIDLSALAKGYGVDEVAAGLYAQGREDFLVEIGGEIRASGERPGGGPWRVAVEQPLDDGREIASVIELRELAMATSGDYRIFYEESGQRISHTIDPRTGYPVVGGPASATVLAPSAAVADAWATALMVLGEKGLPLVEREGLAAMLILRTEEGQLIQRRNSLFPEPMTEKTAKTIDETNVSPTDKPR